jgi:hypothetical protein
VVGVSVKSKGGAAFLANCVFLIVLGIVLFMLGSLPLTTMRGIFSVARILFAKDGVVKGGFTE